MVAVKHFHLQNTDASLPDSEVFFDFLAQYYINAEQAAERAVAEEEVSLDAGRAREVLLPLAPEDPARKGRTNGAAG